MKQVGIIVPTLGTRHEYLITCLTSLRDAQIGYVCVVCPADLDISKLFEAELVDLKVDDPGRGLAAAINAGVQALPENISVINWLGDDDYVNSDSMETALAMLYADRSTVMVYGKCVYVDQDNKIVWRNRSGVFAAKILKFGPCLVPQPGSLIKRQAFNECGALNENLGWAFDLDLFIKLSTLGRLKFIRESLASFRWHNDSLTVAFRKNSVREASQVRVSHLHPKAKKLSFLWEPLIRFATLHSRNLVRTSNLNMNSDSLV